VKESEDSVEIYRSRLKLGGLAVAPAYFAIVAARQLLTGEPPTAFLVGLVVVGFGSAAALLWLAFAKEPAIVIDKRGVTLNWPRVGLIPWAAVAGMGVTRAPLIRSILLIALDEAAAGPEVMARVKPHLTGGLAMNPAVTRFRQQVRNQPVLQVKIAFLDASRADVQRVLEERVRVR
jgi:hypothetical protein